MKNIQYSASVTDDLSISENNYCVVCEATFEEENELKDHMMKHKKVNRKARTFSYDMNEKKAKLKLLKGANRKTDLNIEIKPTCVNMRFSDGAYHEIVMPLLRQWHTEEQSYHPQSIGGGVGLLSRIF